MNLYEDESWEEESSMETPSRDRGLIRAFNDKIDGIYQRKLEERALDAWAYFTSLQLVKKQRLFKAIYFSNYKATERGFELLREQTTKIIPMERLKQKQYFYLFRLYCK